MTNDQNKKKRPEVQPPTKPEIYPIRPAEPTSPINPQAKSLSALFILKQNIQS